MSYSKLYFGKELNEITYEDIEYFFVEAKDESDKIEFKSYYNPDEKNITEMENGIIRAISALLNSEGGIVIWGAPIGKKVEGKKEKIFQGQLSPLDKLIEKDRFISRVTDSITPSPKGIKFQSIEREAQYIYIIEVEQSFYAPHQYNNIYNMRIDGQTKPAPHHYIEALFRKVTFPKLEGYIKLESFTRQGSNFILEIRGFIFNMSKLQNEYDINYRIVVTVGKFANSGMTHYNPNRVYTLEGHEFRALNAKSTLYFNEPLSNTETIIFDTNILRESNFKCDVWFYFGGKQSPLMVSKYELLLNDTSPLAINNLVTLRQENQYSYEESEKNEMSDEERVKRILGR